LAEQHGHELPPASETPGMPLSSVLPDQLFKLQARKELENLRENTAYSSHGGTSSVGIIVSTKQQPQLMEDSALIFKT
jgi:hypothetical protein